MMGGLPTTFLLPQSPKKFGESVWCMVQSENALQKIEPPQVLLGSGHHQYFLLPQVYHEV